MEIFWCVAVGMPSGSMSGGSWSVGRGMLIINAVIVGELRVALRRDIVRQEDEVQGVSRRGSEATNSEGIIPLSAPVCRRSRAAAEVMVCLP